MNIQKALALLLEGKNLRKHEAVRVFRSLFEGKLLKSQVKALLLLLARKGETAEEVAGCLKALQSLERPFPARIRGLMDTCGTGGDRSHSLNISTLAAFVIAGAGGKVAKHGNRSISSKCGSSDLLEALGVNLKAGRARMLQAIRKAGIGYFHAPFYHPVFSRVQPLRRELKVRTIFNLLGPLVNPLGIEAQVIGVSKPKYLKLFAEVLREKKMKNALVCHSEDGLDEISTSAATQAAWVSGNRIRYGKIRPQALGFRRASKKNYKGGGVSANKSLGLKILKGKLRGPARDVVVINAAAGLVVSGRARNLKEGIRLAHLSLDTGKAYQALLKLKEMTNS